MKLPNDCPFSENSSEPSRETEMYPPDCCQAGASSHLIGTDEPPPTEHEVYRFAWNSSFHGDAFVRISSTGRSIRLRSCLFRSRLRLRVLSTSLALAPDDWEKLQCALKTSDFWALDTRNERFGFDGACWLIEGRRGDVYHSVKRWSPGGAVRDLGRLFFALAGPPLADVALY